MATEGKHSGGREWGHIFEVDTELLKITPHVQPITLGFLTNVHFESIVRKDQVKQLPEDSSYDCPTNEEPKLTPSTPMVKAVRSIEGMSDAKFN